MGRLQKYPRIHVSTGGESSGSGTEFTQGFRPQHRRERKPERPSRGLSENGPDLAWRGEPPGFSGVAAGALDLRRGHQGPALVASGKDSPHGVARGPLGIPLTSMPGLRPFVDSVPEPEDSSPVLTWILGYFWSLPMGVSPRLEWGHARALSSRAVAAVSRFPSRGSRDQGLSLETFPRGFPTRLSHRAVPRATVV